MVKVRPSITVYLEKSGQKITLDLAEARELVKSLTAFVSAKPGFKTKNWRTSKEATYRLPAMSDAKKQEILSHVNKQLSAKPRTLSNLLKGISYLPNHLPAIRKMVEDQPSVSKQIIGKRTFYRYKGSKLQSEKGTTASAA